MFAIVVFTVPFNKIVPGILKLIHKCFYFFPFKLYIFRVTSEGFGVEYWIVVFGLNCHVLKYVVTYLIKNRKDKDICQDRRFAIVQHLS